MNSTDNLINPPGPWDTDIENHPSEVGPCLDPYLSSTTNTHVQGPTLVPSCVRSGVCVRGLSMRQGLRLANSQILRIRRTWSVRKVCVPSGITEKMASMYTGLEAHADPESNVAAPADIVVTGQIIRAPKYSPAYHRLLGY